MDLLEVNIEKKVFLLNGEILNVLDNIKFKVKPSEFISIIGPSGCGKSTILKIILGLDTDYIGSVMLNGKLIKETGLDRGIVFQDHRLLPWLTVKDNIGFALPNKNKDENLIASTIELVGLQGFESAWPNQLSGGMAQRVAIARAIINVPKLLLLDEAFGSLDDFTRAKMQLELKKIVDNRQVTTIMVTHNIEEAVMLSDRVIILRDKPSSISNIVPINFVGTRDKEGKDFIFYRNKLINEL